MSCILWGAGLVVFAVLCVGLLVAYLVDWDRVIREAVSEVEREWQEGRRHD